MTDKEQVENIVRKIAASFSGAQSTKDWTDETLWFDGARLGRNNRGIRTRGNGNGSTENRREHSAF